MPSKSSASTAAASKSTAAVPSATVKQTASTGNVSSIEQKLDQILLHLHNLDRRDRIRTIGGSIRGVLGLIPLVVLLGSVWFAYTHGEEFMQKIIEQSTKQAALMVPSMNTPSLEEIQEYFRAQREQ